MISNTPIKSLFNGGITYLILKVDLPIQRDRQGYGLVERLGQNRFLHPAILNEHGLHRFVYCRTLLRNFHRVVGNNVLSLVRWARPMQNICYQFRIR